jgi:hypothetical protein
MSTKVTVTLTLDEAKELQHVAGNGWGDGDFYGLNDEHPTRGGQESANKFCSAREKLAAAIRKAEQK